MSAGTMRERVSIVRPTRVQRADGDFNETALVTVATVWASVTPLDGKEIAAAGMQTGSQMYAVTMYRRGDLKTDDQLWWMPQTGVTRKLNIRSIGVPSRRTLTIDVLAEYGTPKLAPALPGEGGG